MTASTRLLAIESATDWLSIALCDGPDCVLERSATETRQHASALMPMIAEALETAGWALDSVGALGVSIGPGSFTSLRIGLATAKGLAFGRGWRAVGVSTLEAMAAPVLADEGASGPVLALLDARRGEWYAGAWGRSEAGRSNVLAEGLYVPETLAADLGDAVTGGTIVCPEPSRWNEALAAVGIEPSQVVEGEAARPRARAIGQLAWAGLERGEGGPVEALAARYLRRAEAEAKRLGAPVEPGAVARVRGASE